MKNIILFAFLALASFSCNPEETPDVGESIEGKWALITDKRPHIQQLMTDYVFNQDGTFIKSVPGIEQVAGTFTQTAPDPNDKNVRFYLILTYESESYLIDNCTSGKTEDLVVMNNDTMENNLSLCDGSKLIYQKE